MLEDGKKYAFIGEARYQLDSSRRVNIPAKMRKSLNPVNEKTFVIARGMDCCVDVIPRDRWEMRLDELLKLNAGSRNSRQTIREFTRYASEVKYDGQGRIMLNDDLLSYAKITSEVVIVGALDHIEIWDPAILQEYELSEEARVESIESISQEVKL